jgi:spore coat protein A, manganese oxidase
MKAAVSKAVGFVVLAILVSGTHAAPDLAPYKDKLPIPPTLLPASDDGSTRVYRIRMQNGKRKLHSDLPIETPFWGYDGQYPGPTIDVPRERKVVVEFINSLDKPADESNPRTQWPFAIPPDLTMGGVPYFVPPKPWTVVHLHGSPTRPEYDGWADNAFFHDESVHYYYPKHEQGALLWYHDHANMVTRLNVYAGLAGLYLVRDKSTDAHYPSGKHEIPLVIQDRDFELTSDGTAFTGRFQYQALNSNTKFEPMSKIFLVNGTVRPYCEVDRCKYRLRILNGANARFLRLAFQTESDPPNTKAWDVIGVDGGLLETHVPNPTTAAPTPFNPMARKEMVVLGPAERLDVVVDFGQYAAGTNIEMVTLTPNGVMLGRVLQFRVGSATTPPVVVAAPPTIARSPRLASAGVAAAAVAGSPARTRTIGLYTKGGMQTINGLMFHDAIEEIPTLDSEEIWEFLNVTGDDHPMHLHLVNFEIIDRQRIKTDLAVLPDLEKFDAIFRTWLADTSPSRPRLPPGILFAPGSSPVPAEAYEKGPKDTVRVSTNTLTRIKVKFRLHVGLYMYHCHILDHEDMEMMRPLLVVPPGMPAMGQRGGGAMSGH